VNTAEKVASFYRLTNLANSVDADRWMDPGILVHSASAKVADDLAKDAGVTSGHVTLAFRAHLSGVRRKPILLEHVVKRGEIGRLCCKHFVELTSGRL
jgi:hypothetical protein